MSAEESVFIFDINESLFFRQNQLVRDMLSLSLNPEITIEQYDTYVSIRGVLDLTGEFTLQEDRDEYEYSVDDYTKRYITNVEEINDNYAIFTHLLPVDISIPLYRVKSFDDLTVAITEFDYEIKDDQQLMIQAEMSIYGIDQSEERIVEEEVPYIDDVIEMDVIHPTIEEEKEEVKEEETLNVPEIEERMQEEKEEEKLEPKLNIKEEKEEEEMINFDTRERKFETASEEKEEVIEREVVQEANLEVEDHQEMEREEELEDESSPNDFLSALFGNESEENRYTKMRLCIVQSGDTVETIAERYDVPILQIVKYNGLEDGAINPGELLYIPQSKKRAK